MQGINSVAEELDKQRFKVSRLIELERISSRRHSLSWQLLDTLVEAGDLAREIEAVEDSEGLVA